MSLYNGIINPIAEFLGYILNILFNAMYAVGLGNIGIAIIIFTVIVKLAMLPLTIKQQRSVKVSAIMNPELNAIREKYKGKKDQQSLMQMNAENKALNEKYGVSQVGGCIQMLIQFPILMALYNVFRNISDYVGHLNTLLTSVLNGTNGIMSQDGYLDTMNAHFSMSGIDWSSVTSATKGLNSFTQAQWDELATYFGSGVADNINNNASQIIHMNMFLGVNMSVNPGTVMGIAIIIPILSGLSQYISVKMTQSKTMMDEDNPAASSMKMMTLFMPLMSAFFAFSVPAGLGVYWIATAVVQTLIQLCVNRYYDKIGVDEIIRRSAEKRKKKMARKGITSTDISKNASMNTKSIARAAMNQQRADALREKREANEKKVKDIMDSSAAAQKTAKPGSLAEKAGLVAKYNAKNEKKKK